MRQKKILPLFALVGLLSLSACQNQASSSGLPSGTSSSTGGSSSTSSSSPTGDSSTSSSTPGSTDPVVTTTNYQRKGELSLDLEAGGLVPAIVGLQPMHYDSEIQYTFEKVSDGSAIDDAEILLSPNTVLDTEQGSPYSVENNFSMLYTLFGFPSSLPTLTNLVGAMGVSLPSMPDDMLLASKAYRDNAAAQEKTEETFAVNLVSGKKAVFTATSDDRLRAYEESDVSGLFDQISGIDIPEMAETILPLLENMDAATVLNLIDGLVDSMLPEETLRPILVAIGDAVDILSEGLDVTITPDATYADGASTIVLSLNEAGLEKSSEAIAGLLGDDPMMSMIAPTLTQASVGLEVFNEKGKDLLNQVGGLELDLGLSLLGSPIELHLDLSFDKESTQAPADYFAAVSEKMESYATTDAAFHSYYEKVKPYLTDKAGIDLGSQTASTIASLKQDYDALPDDVKFLFGSDFQPDSISALYDEGRTKLEELFTNWESHDKEFPTLSSIGTFLSDVKGYANWRGAIAENAEKGEAILTTIDTAVADRLAEIKTGVETMLSDLEAFRKDIADAEAIAAVLKDIKDNPAGEIADDDYFYLLSVEQQSEAKELASSVSTYAEDVYQAYADGLFASLTKEGVTITYDLLVETLLGENTFYSTASSYQYAIRPILAATLDKAENADLKKTITSTLDGEVELLKAEAVQTFKETADKETWDGYKKEVTTKLQEVNKLALAFLDQSSITNEVSDLLSTLSTYFEA